MTKPTQMKKLEEIVRALEWAKRTGRLEYTRRTNLNGDYCDGVDAFDRALTLARELRDNAEKIQVCPSCHRTDSKGYPSGVCTVCYAGTYAPALLITDPNP